MNSCILNEILLNTDKFSPIAKNPLLKDLRIPNGYFVNNIPNKPIPLIYNNLSEYVDDKCIDKCLKLVEVPEHLPKNKKTKKTKKSSSPKNIRKTKKVKNK